jgi:hypothetical protein
MANNVQIKFDIDNKSLEIAGQETMKLTQQIRILKGELGKGTYSQEQFEILSKTLGDVEDQFAKTKARSGDLFTSLQLIPGPIGEIASKFNGTIALMKTFSSFSLTDLKFQLGETLGDIKDIGTWLGKATGITKIYTTLNNALASSFVKVGVGEAAAATGARAFAAALTATGVGALVVGLGFAISALMEFADSSDDAKQATDELNASLESQNRILDLNAKDMKRRQELNLAQMKTAGASEKQIRDQQLKDAQETYDAAVQARIDAAKKYNEGLGKVDAEGLKKLGDNLEQREQAEKDAYTAGRILRLNNDAANKKDAENAAKDAKSRTDKTEQDRKQFEADKLKNQKEALDAQIELEISSANTSASNLEALYKKRNQFELDELANVDKNAKTLLNNKKITDQEYLNIIQGTEAKRQLLAQKTSESIQKSTDDDQKVLDDKKKNDEEAIKNTEEFNRKIRDLKTAAILDDNAREKQARMDKYNDDLKALEEDKEFVKKSEEEKGEIRKNLKTIYNNDINKIDETQRNKEFEDEQKAKDRRLKLLELQGQGLIQGTKAYFNNRAELLKVSEAQEKAELKKQLDDGKLTREQYEQAVTATEAKYTNLRKDLKRQELAALGQTISATLDAFANLGNAIAGTYDEEAKTSEKAFEKRKKLQVATAIMSAASGLVQILTQPSTLPSPFDWIVKGINALALGIATKTNIDKIKATKFESPESSSGGAQPYKVTANRASGGIVTGPGTSTSDSINARLSNGEYVVNARATSAFLPLLNSINDSGLRPGFAAGGLFTSPVNSSNMSSDSIARAIETSITDRPLKTYVVGTEMSNQQQFDRTIKSRSVI